MQEEAGLIRLPSYPVPPGPPSPGCSLSAALPHLYAHFGGRTRPGLAALCKGPGTHRGRDVHTNTTPPAATQWYRPTGSLGITSVLHINIPILCNKYHHTALLSPHSPTSNLGRSNLLNALFPIRGGSGQSLNSTGVKRATLQYSGNFR